MYKSFHRKLETVSARRETLRGLHIPYSDRIQNFDVIELNGAFWVAYQWYIDGWYFLPMDEQGNEIVGDVKFFRHSDIMSGHALWG